MELADLVENALEGASTEDQWVSLRRDAILDGMRTEM